MTSLFATLKSVCVEDQHGRVVFTVPSTFVHKPLPARWVTSSHVLRLFTVSFW